MQTKAKFAEYVPQCSMLEQSQQPVSGTKLDQQCRFLILAFLFKLMMNQKFALSELRHSIRGDKQLSSRPIRLTYPHKPTTQTASATVFLKFDIALDL